MACFTLLSTLAFPLCAATNIDDPGAFVTRVYQRFARSQSGGADYAPPEDIYTRHLAKLMSDERKRSNGETGCVDFVFWVNGQDWRLKNVSVSTKILGQARRRVIAKFTNLGSPEEIQFDFERVAGQWLIADVRSLREPRWTLSELLRCQP